VAILTQPSDRPVMDQEWRDSKEHVADVAAVMAAVAEWINTGTAPGYINQEKTQ
jgi:hypothetical protein